MLEPSGSWPSVTPFLALAVITLVSALFLKLVREGSGAKNLPKGSLGLPVIGESFSFFRAHAKDRFSEWVNERVSKYGTAFKTSIMGSPTVFITGQAGNKFILGADDNVLAPSIPKTLSEIAGKQNFFEIRGARYKMIKSAIVTFLKPESLQLYVKIMEDLVEKQLAKDFRDQGIVKIVPFMKKLSFDIACAILFGIQDEPSKDALFEDFNIAFKAVWSIPVNYPGTPFRRGMKARSRIVNRMLPLVRARKEEISKGLLSPTNDVISCMLSLRTENQPPLTEEEIMANFIMLIIASHDTSSILLTLMIWKLARDPNIYQKVSEEQQSILKEKKGTGGKLTWSDIQKMKYTWRVAQELMRIIPPVFGGCRVALKDTGFGGYEIPKGWMVHWTADPTHMSNDIFNNPTLFDPSRFENPSKPIPPFTYVPFGGGLHMCIGSEFAKVETMVIVHQFVTKFEWSEVNPEEQITRQPMPYPSMGLPIKLKARNLYL